VVAGAAQAASANNNAINQLEINPIPFFFI
jgi:hypothetical protein